MSGGAAELLAIVSGLIDLLQVAQRLAPQLSIEIQAVSNIVKAARDEGRDFTPVERDAVLAIVALAQKRAHDVVESMPR